jgi:hypothetical protein
VVAEQAFPLELKVPDAETRAAETDEIVAKASAICGKVDAGVISPLAGEKAISTS